MDYRSALSEIVQRRDLSLESAQSLMEEMLSGQMTDAQVAALLTALACKGASGYELAGFATAMRGKGHSLSPPFDVVDTCGTGGGSPSFNISTGAAIVVAACGVKVAKHGNRAVTSSCGSADVLEALGVRITNDPETALHLLETVGISFLFAQNYHPALKAIGKVRRELQIRTVFNQLGPLANPAGATAQAIGVYDRKLMKPMAEAAQKLSTLTKALILHGEDGLDEASPCANTHYIYIDGKEMSAGVFRASDFIEAPLDSSDIAPAQTIEENAVLLESALQNVHPWASALVPSASCVLWLARGGDLQDAIREVKEALSSGKAHAKLREFVEASAAQ